MWVISGVFPGVPQTYNAMARSTSDVQLLSLEKAAYAQLISGYPEQHDIIITNLLQKFDISKDGSDGLSMQQMSLQEDESHSQLRQLIKVLLDLPTTDLYTLPACGQ